MVNFSDLYYVIKIDNMIRNIGLTEMMVIGMAILILFPKVRKTIYLILKPLNK
jgi:hypothetical protein